MAEMFVGRQPVLDRDLELWGYELLFRGSRENHASFSDAGEATSQVILNSLVDIGLERVVGANRALINLPRDFLVGEFAEILPADTVVLEVLEDVVVDADLVRGVERLAADGYLIALDDFAFEARWEPLVETAHLIKVEVPQLASWDGVKVQASVADLKRRGKQLLAEKVETRAEFEHYRDLGFDYFQGYFFSKPNLVQGNRLPGNRLQALRLLAKLNEPDVSVKELERLVAANMDLSYKVLRLLNSARYALPRTITSVHEAIMLIGLRQLRTLATIVAMAGIDDKPSVLISLALVRARTCEQLAAQAGDARADTCFTVGMLSTLDALLDRPLEALLDELPLSVEVRDALLSGSGDAGRFLAWALACERADQGDLDAIGLPTPQVARTYLDAIQWARETLAELNE